MRLEYSITSMMRSCWTMRPGKGRDRGRGKPPEQAQAYHPAREVTAIVLDYFPEGYYADPHKEHRNKPVAQALGLRSFLLLDGIPLEPVDSLEYVSLAREIERTLPVPGPGRVREKTFKLACMPGADKNIYCLPLNVRDPALVRLLAETIESENPKVTVVTDLRALKSVAAERGLPDKILVVPRRPLTFNDLSDYAKSVLEEAVKKVIRDNEDVFVEFFNIAEPINIRLHSLNLLKGIGRRTLLQLIEKRPFKSLAEVKKIIRTDPVESLAEKILEEIRGEAKYYLFVRPPPGVEAPFFNYYEEARKRAKRK